MPRCKNYSAQNYGYGVGYRVGSFIHNFFEFVLDFNEGIFLGTKRAGEESRMRSAEKEKEARGK